MTLSQLLMGTVALIQVAIAVVEMFFWRLPKVHDRLGFTQAVADQVAPIVANAGLYNAFLAVGLIWSIAGNSAPASAATFFLSCVAVAGVFGAATLKWTTLVLQTLPALAALLALWWPVVRG